MQDEWEEEEQLVVVELSGIINNEFLSKCQGTCKILGIDSENPMMQVGQYVFAGEYEDTLGTCVLFEAVPNKEKPASSPELKYMCHTVKKLMMQRIFLTEKKEGSGDSDKQDIACQSIQEEDAAQQGKTEEEMGKTEEEIGNTEEEIGNTEEEIGNTEEEIGKTEEEMGKTEEEMGKTEEEMGKMEEEMGNTEEEMGKTEEEKGKTEEEMGKTEEEMGKTEEEMGKTEEEMGKTEEEIGNTEEEIVKTEEEMGKTDLEDSAS